MFALADLLAVGSKECHHVHQMTEVDVAVLHPGREVDSVVVLKDYLQLEVWMPEAGFAEYWVQVLEDQEHVGLED